MLNLEQVQGNIRKSFARKHGVYLFVNFAGNTSTVRPRLKQILDDYIVSDAEQARITEQWNLDRSQLSDGVGMFGISYAGYVRLGLSAIAPPPPGGSLRPFQQGLRNVEYIWNPEVDGWEQIYRDNEFHAYLLLADDDFDRLTQTAATAATRLNTIGAVVHRESGKRLFPPDSGHEIEHYGFREGIAKTRDPESVFTPDPAGNGMGTYAAFLKFEQNVKAFIDRARQIALQAGVDAASVQARAVGRRQSGEPLAPVQNGDIDDFTFVGVSNVQCPQHAHIRVMNERAPTVPEKILLRRGMGYGPPRTDMQNPDTPPPTAGSGMLFLSFQQDLFHLIGLMGRAQNRLDPMLTRSSRWPTDLPRPCGSHLPPGQTWTFAGGQVCSPIADITTLKGGEYFYSPGMGFIEAL